MKGNHLTHMLLGGAAILAVLLVAGVPLGAALPYAFVLACPLMMFAMMFMMGRGNGNGGGGHGGCGHDHGPDTGPDAAKAEPCAPVTLTKSNADVRAVDAEYRR